MCMQGPALPQAGYAYGSAAADQAVQKLQSLGAKVYPPEAKDVMDWGVLAGGLAHTAKSTDRNNRLHQKQSFPPQLLMQPGMHELVG